MKSKPNCTVELGGQEPMKPGTQAIVLETPIIKQIFAFHILVM